jgi:hypothetical protein
MSCLSDLLFCGAKWQRRRVQPLVITVKPKLPGVIENHRLVLVTVINTLSSKPPSEGLFTIPHFRMRT